MDYIPVPKDFRLLIVDDNTVFLERLALAMEKRGFHVTKAKGIKEATALLNTYFPDYAIIDLKLEDGYGLDIIKPLHEKNPNVRAIMLTAYANIASAVTSIKMGAIDYLPKPADADQIFAALMGKSSRTLEPSKETMLSPDRLRWEYIQRTFEECGHNISQTARRLNMHRRTLQRILAKYAPRT